MLETLTPSRFSRDQEDVYLLHFERPYKHARHYVGKAWDLERRIAEHKRCNGHKYSALVKAAKDAGIGFILARVWRGAGYGFEMFIKHRHKDLPALCPICNPRAEHNLNGGSCNGSGK